MCLSFPTSPSWNRCSSSANQSDSTCCRWSYFGILLTIEFIVASLFNPCFCFIQPNSKSRFSANYFFSYLKPVFCVYLDQQSTAVATKCERSIFVGRTVILFTFVFGVLPSFKERIKGFLFSFLFSSLSDLFKSGFFVAGASKTQSFWVFTGFYYKNKRDVQG